MHFFIPRNLRTEPRCGNIYFEKIMKNVPAFQLKPMTSGHGRTAVLAREVVLLFAVLTISVISAEFAHWFREIIIRTVELIYGNSKSTVAVFTSNRWKVFLVVVAVVVVARYSAIAANKIGKGRLGFSYISHAPSEEEERKGGISLGGTLMRSFGIFAVSIGASSIGREAAILETCGALGHSLGKKLWNAGPVIASAGIAAAFAGAYHAPIGGIIYVFGHARSWRSKRSLAYAAIGAAISYFFTVHEFGNRPIFAIKIQSVHAMFILGLIGLIPAIVGSRLLLELRDRAAKRHLVRLHPVASSILMIVIAAACVSLSPLTAGNGMEAIRTAAVSFTVWVGIALALTKMLAIVATIGSRAPGGVFAPTLSVSAGWALLTFIALHNLGVPLPGTYWDGMVVAMSVGVAVGLQSPLLGMVVVAEMTGQIQFVPVIAVIVFLAIQINKIVDKQVMSRTHRLPSIFQDQDA